MLKEHQISFDLLRPLILKTASNARKKDLFRLQTGPAVRGDRNTIASHIQLLKHNPEYRDLYEQITHLIIQNKKRHGKL